MWAVGEPIPGNCRCFFRTPGWQEVRLDADTTCEPDIFACMTSMPVVATAGFAAVISSYNLERLYPHEVIQALKEFHQVLTPDMFDLVTVFKGVVHWLSDGFLVAFFSVKFHKVLTAVSNVLPCIAAELF